MQLPLKKLRRGDKVFAYMEGLGYVGYGEVTNEAVMAKDFAVEDRQCRLFDLPLTQDGIKENADSPEMSDWAVGVRWVRAVPKDQAKRYPGVFANQSIVCKLQDKPTLALLKTEFRIADD